MMTGEHAVHPPRDTLAAYGLGKLQPTEAVIVETHIAECEECCETLLDLGNDTFADLVRRSDVAKLDGMSVDGTVGLHETQKEASRELPDELKRHSRYRVSELLGRGGMGSVYKAEHMLMDRPVALKLINRRWVGNEQAVKRFRREVQAAAKLTHPNIVTAHDAEQAGDVHYLVMEYVPGDDLSDVVKRDGPLDISLACDYIRQAALGLQHAHEQGMVHRDIKPHNLMVTSDGTVKILDFGLATLATEAVADEATAEPARDKPTASKTSRLTTLGTMMGTPDFISPEQASEPHAADIRSDVYSLGCTFYYLLTGRPPFTEGSALDRVKAHGELEADPIENLRTDIPPELVNVVQRMMAKVPSERFQTPGDVAEALEPFVDTPRTIPAARRVIRPQPRTASSRRSWWPWAMATVLTLAASILAGAIYVTTDNGTLVVESPDDNVEIIVRSGDAGLRIVDTLTGSIAKRLPTGKYVVELHGDDNDYELDKGQFVLKRGGHVIVRVTRHRDNGRTRRRIWTEADDTSGELIDLINGAPSLDGRVMSFLSWKNGDLGVFDLATGSRRYLTQSGDITNGYAYFSLPSPDAKKIAYNWSIRSDSDSQLRVIDVGTGQDRILFRNPDGPASVYPRAWSRDSQTVIAVLETPATATQIAAFPANGEPYRVLKSLDWRWPATTDLSPDGKYLVFDAQVDKDSPDRDIFLLPTDGEGDQVQLQHPAVDTHPLWTPDGRGVVFFSDRGESESLWYQEVTAGEALGNPRLLVENLKVSSKRGRPLGFTSDGSYYFAKIADERRVGDIYSVELNTTGDKVVGKPRRLILRNEGANTLPSWSPDGTSLAYTSFRTKPEIVICDIDTGIERLLDVSGGEGTRFGWWSFPRDYSPVWSRLGSLLVTGNLVDGSGPNRGLYSIDVNTGQVTPLVTREIVPAFAWSRDGNTYYWSRVVFDESNPVASQIVSKKLSASNETIIYEHPRTTNHRPFIFSLALSPDGNELAFATGDMIGTLSLGDRKARQLFRLTSDAGISMGTGLVWTPRGNSVIFGKTKNGDQSGRGTASTLPPVELWKVSAEAAGGRAVNLGLPADRIHHLSLHPDGKQITYCRKPPLEEQPGNEIWVIDHLLPTMEQKNDTEDETVTSYR